MAGTIAPTAVQTFLDRDGNPLPGARLYTYASGTSTPLAIYSDVDLLVPLSNPAVADSAGRLAFYMPAGSYKFVLKDASDVIQWTQDPVFVVPGTDLVLATAAQAASLYGKNLVSNGTMLIWSQGDAAAPDSYVLSGSGAAVARTGPGQGDTQALKYGTYAAKVTFGSAAAKLTQTLLNATAFAKAFGLRGRSFQVGARCLTAVASQARLVVDDGVTVTQGTPHTGNNTDAWITVSHTINAAATKLDIYAEVYAAGAAYFGGLTAAFGQLALTDWIPEESSVRTLYYREPGVVQVGTKKIVFWLQRPGIVQRVTLKVESAPAGSEALIDVNTWDGAAYTSMFSARPSITVGSFAGSAVPDSTYARRCALPFMGVEPIGAGRLISVDVDARGDDPGMQTLVVEIQVQVFSSPLESLRASDDW